MRQIGIFRGFSEDKAVCTELRQILPTESAYDAKNRIARELVQEGETNDTFPFLFVCSVEQKIGSKELC